MVKPSHNPQYCVDTVGEETTMKSIKRGSQLVGLGLAVLYVPIVFFTMVHLDGIPCTMTTLNILKDVASPGNVSYASALSTLRCLATPKCFPRSKCRNGVPKKIKRAKQWEEHSLCVEDVQQKNCLVYSFGIHTSWEWEEKMARLLHCEVHAFDPTMNHPTNLAPNVTFHKLGLQAEGTDMSATHAAEYDAIDPKLLLTLGQIMTQLGHAGRKLDVLALDCEGCEWGALRQLACSGESSLVDQLFVEFHFQKNLGLATSADVVQAAQGIDCLWQHRWHVVAMEGSGASPKEWKYAKDVTQIIDSVGFLLYLSLQRIPDNQPRPSDYLEQAVRLSAEVTVAEEDFSAKYKTEDQNKWPEDAKEIVAKLRREKDEAYTLKYRMSRESNEQFEEYDRLAE
jgi:Methyltransferase domain